MKRITWTGLVMVLLAHAAAAQTTNVLYRGRTASTDFIHQLDACTELSGFVLATESVTHSGPSQPEFETHLIVSLTRRNLCLPEWPPESFIWFEVSESEGVVFDRETVTVKGTWWGYDSYTGSETPVTIDLAWAPISKFTSNYRSSNRYVYEQERVRVRSTGTGVQAALTGSVAAYGSEYTGTDYYAFLELTRTGTLTVTMR